MLRNLFILSIVMFIGGIYYRYSISKSKEMQNIAFFLKISLLLLSLILAFTGKKFIFIGKFKLLVEELPVEWCLCSLKLQMLSSDRKKLIVTQIG